MQIPGVSGAMVGGPGGIDPSAMFGGVHGFPPQWPPLAGSGFIPPPVSLSNDGCALRPCDERQRQSRGRTVSQCHVCLNPQPVSRLIVACSGAPLVAFHGLRPERLVVESGR